MRVRTKLLAGFAGFALLVPVIGVTAYVRVNNINAGLHAISDGAIGDMTKIAEVKKLQSEQEQAAVAYFSGGQAADQQRFKELGQKADASLEEVKRLLIEDSDTPGMRALVNELTQARVKFNAQAAYLFAARAQQDSDINALNAKYRDISTELKTVRTRFIPIGANTGDGTAIPTPLRNQVNDVILAGEGMLHMVAFQWALVNEDTLLRSKDGREQFKASNQNFQNWLELGMTTGGPDDRAIFTRVQAKYAEFYAVSQLMFAGNDELLKERASFDGAAGGFAAVIDRVSRLEENFVGDVKASAQTAVTTTRILVVSMTAVAFLSAALAGLWLTERITRPLVELRNKADDISMNRTDDLSFEIGGKDEIGDLTTSFRRMVMSFRYAVQQQARDDVPADESSSVRAA